MAEQPIFKYTSSTIVYVVAHEELLVTIHNKFTTVVKRTIRAIVCWSIILPRVTALFQSWRRITASSEGQRREVMEPVSLVTPRLPVNFRIDNLHYVPASDTARH